MPAIRVLCVDDNELVCSAMQRKLREPEFDFIGSLNSTTGLIQLMERDRPDLLIIDVDMPGSDVAAALRDIKKRLPGTRVAALSGVLDDATIDRILEAGADAYISKSEDSRTIIDSFRRVAGG